MIRRPKATDTEEDLLSLQESFLASGELPSASLHSEQASASKKKVHVGEKRRDHGDNTSTAGMLPERDVVELHPQGVCTLQFNKEGGSLSYSTIVLHAQGYDIIIFMYVVYMTTQW